MIPVPLRRALFAAFAAGVAALLFGLAWRALAPGGWNGWKALLLACFAGTLPWTAICAANGVFGFIILLGARRPAEAVTPVLALLRPETPIPPAVIAVCIRHEAMAQVLPPLGRLLDALSAVGQASIPLWILSDSQDPALVAAEEAAVRDFRVGRASAVHYRRRAENTGFKAGNIMEFLDHHAGAAEVMVCLDADSEMSAAAVLRLLRCMAAEPRLAILQQLVVGRPATAAFPRLFQFGMRAGMRSWATGQGWWQAHEGPYWGHNAAIRIAPFREHARLPETPAGRPILSHDQLEAVRLHAAGWLVFCLPEETGSQEGNPPALPEFFARDLRWAAGNMQYFSMLRLPGLRAMGRWQLMQAILLFVGAPFWLGVFVFAVLNAATGGGVGAPPGALLAWMLASWAALHAPKLLGYAQVLMQGREAARYGGRPRFLAGAGLELVFTTLLDPVSVFVKARFLLALALGRAAPGWAAQNRAERGVSWHDAARLLWPPTLFGALAFGLLAAAAPAALRWALPLAGGLLCAIPLCVLTASPRLSGWLRRHPLAATPEELGH